MTATTAELRRLPVFARLSRRALARADSLTTMVAFDAGEELMHQGRLGREAFVIVSGTATVTRDDQLLADVGPGDVVGEAALLAGDHYRNATVTATSPLSALVLSWQEFASLMELPGIADTIHDLQESRRAS